MRLLRPSPAHRLEWLRCLLFILLSGRHPFNCDLGGRLLVPEFLTLSHAREQMVVRRVPSAVLGIWGSVPPEPDWRLPVSQPL